MNFSEKAVVFEAAGEPLLGIVAEPDISAECGVLLIVGGPQYRAGSHRQFLLLSRRLASEGYPVLRFDYRGMGDSGGAMRDFEAVSEDIGAAIDALLRNCPNVRRVVLWGLCDAASGALLYVQACGDRRVAGLVLLNPWVRSEASLAQTHIKHYYGQRLMQREFWFKLLSGKMHVLKSIKDLLSSVTRARGRRVQAGNESLSFQDRMSEGLKRFPGVVLVILSGQDYTAKEFLEFVGASPSWAGLMAANNVTRVDIPDADHTFSGTALRSTVENVTLQWLGRV